MWKTLALSSLSLGGYPVYKRVTAVQEFIALFLAEAVSWCRVTTERTPLITINGNLNAVRYRDEIIQANIITFVQG